MDLPGQLHCVYLAEGAANIVYRITHIAESGLIADTLGRQTSPPAASTSPAASITFKNAQRLSSQASSSAVDSIPQGLTLEEPYPLLRVRKELAHLPSNSDQYDRINSSLKPLLPSNTLIQHRLVVLPAHLRDRLNASLRVDEASGARPLSRHGAYIATSEPHALLVQDMTATPNAFSLQLKPKWLVQSPNAPRTARRCRTCALHEMRESEYRQDKRLSRPRESASFCPLDLASGQRDGVERAIDMILESNSQTSGGTYSPDAAVRPHVRDVFVKFLLESPILARLRDLQRALDTEGVLSLNDEFDISEEFQLATTLRDCSLFLRATWLDDGELDKDNQDKRHLSSNGVKVSMDDPLAVEAAKRRPHVEGLLGDLDLKRPERDKLLYWRETEETLIRDGWYDGRRAARPPSSGGTKRESCLCRLERKL